MQRLHTTIRAVALATLSLVAAAHADATPPTRRHYRLPPIPRDPRVFVPARSLLPGNPTRGDPPPLNHPILRARDLRL